MSCTGGIESFTFDSYSKALKKQEKIKVMSKRKFNDGEFAVANDKISKAFQQSGIKPGTEVKIDSMYYQGYYRVNFNGLRYDIPSNQLSKHIPKSSLESFQEQIDKAMEKIEATKSFIAETQAKIDYMKETGSEMFNENEFKAFHTLTIIEQSDMSKIEKAKAIAALISGK